MSEATAYRWHPAIRRLWPRDEKAFARHLGRLSGDARRLRFGTPAGNAFIRDYAARAFGLDAIIEACGVGKTVRGVVEVRPVGVDWPAMAELAITVEPDWQQQGMGTALMARAILAARNRYIQRIYMICLSENRPMQGLARKFEADLSVEPSECEGRIRSPWPTPLSMLRETLAESDGFVTAVFNAGKAVPPRTGHTRRSRP